MVRHGVEFRPGGPGEQVVRLVGRAEGDRPPRPSSALAAPNGVFPL